MYDLDLLRDPIYVNMMMGMSVAIFAEANFSLLTPFILADMNMTTPQIASAMSLIAMCDLVFRGLAPFLGEWLRQPPRMMYLLSLCLLIISRTCNVYWLLNSEFKKRKEGKERPSRAKETEKSGEFMIVFLFISRRSSALHNHHYLGDDRGGRLGNSERNPIGLYGTGDS